MSDKAEFGVITNGAAYQYVKEALGDKASVLKLGMVNPLPVKLIQDFAKKYEQVYVIEELDGEKDKCLYIGDSDVDVITAKNAHIDFCGVEWGFRGADELISAGAKTVVKKPSDILNLVCVNE